LFREFIAKRNRNVTAKLLLQGHSCYDCTKNLHCNFPGKQKIICVIKEGTPEREICHLWEEVEE
jgi:hypothetical protein